MERASRPPHQHCATLARAGCKRCGKGTMRFLSFAAHAINKNVLKIYKRAGAARSGVCSTRSKRRGFFAEQGRSAGHTTHWQADAQSCPAGRCRAVHQHAVQYRGPDLHRQHPRHRRTCADGSGRYVPHHPAGLGLCRIRRNGRRAAGFHPAGRRQP